MIEGLPGLIAIGVVATFGFLMMRGLSDRRRGANATSDASTGSDYSASGGGWLSGLFSSSDSSSSSHDSGSSFDSSSDSGGGGGDGGGGGGD